MDKQKIDGFKDGRGVIWWFGQTDANLEIKYIATGTIETGCSRGGHYHKYMSEKIFCVEGTLLFILDDEELVLKSGDMASIPAGTVHTVVNIGSKIAFFVEIKDREITDKEKDTFFKDKK